MVTAWARLTFEDQISAIGAENLAPFAEKPAQLEYALKLFKGGDRDSRIGLLGSALLPAAVSAFEEFLGALVRSAFTAHPQGLGAFKDVPWNVVERYGANTETRDLHRWALDVKALTFIRGTPDEWRKRIHSWSGIDLANVGLDWDVILECIQRRHVLSHRGGRVDDEYLQNVPERFRSDAAVGQRLTCDRQYMNGVLDQIDSVASVFAVLWASHFFNADGEVVIPCTVPKPVRTGHELRFCSVGQDQ